MHCMTVSLAQGGAGLGTMWGEELAEEMLTDAGFTELVKHKLPRLHQRVLRDEEGVGGGLHDRPSDGKRVLKIRRAA